MSLHEHPTGYERIAADFYVEPAWAVEALFAAECFVGSVHDPAAGMGTIAGVARERGFVDASGSDLHDRNAPTHFNIQKRDFLNHDVNFWADNIISNPPYGNAENFIPHFPDEPDLPCDEMKNQV